MSAIPQFVKRLEARIALALSQAKSNAAGISALSNHLSQINPAPIGPSNSLIFSSTAFTSRSGKVLVMANALIAAGGGTMVAGDIVTGTPIRDGAPTVAFPGPTSNMTVGAIVGATAFTGSYIDTVVAGVPHTWGILAQISAGHTGVIVTQGGLVTILDLPG
jgi:hypothetical protein